MDSVDGSFRDFFARVEERSAFLIRLRFRRKLFSDSSLSSSASSPSCSSPSSSIVLRRFDFALEEAVASSSSSLTSLSSSSSSLGARDSADHFLRFLETAGFFDYKSNKQKEND